MARTAFTRVQGSKGGTVLPAAVAADTTNGNVVQWDERTGIIAKNTNASSTSRNIIFTPVRTVDGQAATPRTEPIPAGETQFFSGLDVADYGEALMIDGSHAEVVIQVVRV